MRLGVKMASVTRRYTEETRRCAFVTDNSTDCPRRAKRRARLLWPCWKPLESVRSDAGQQSIGTLADGFAALVPLLACKCHRAGGSCAAPSCMGSGGTSSCPRHVPPYWPAGARRDRSGRRYSGLHLAWHLLSNAAYERRTSPRGLAHFSATAPEQDNCIIRILRRCPGSGTSGSSNHHPWTEREHWYDPGMTRDSRDNTLDNARGTRFALLLRALCFLLRVREPVRDDDCMTDRARLEWECHVGRGSNPPWMFGLPPNCGGSALFLVITSSPPLIPHVPHVPHVPHAPIELARGWQVSHPRDPSVRDYQRGSWAG